MSTDRRRSGEGGPRVRVITRQLAATVVAFILLMGGMVAYNVRATQGQAAEAMQINVAGRQRQLVDNYIQDVLLETQGFTADPSLPLAALRASATALLDGGRAPTPRPGGDDSAVLIGHAPVTGAYVTLPRVNNLKLRRKLQQEAALVTGLAAQGDRVLANGSGAAGDTADVLALRIDGARTETVSGDAAFQLTTDVQASMARLARVEGVLGFLTALTALGMALLLVRAAARQSNRFRSLVHNSWDIICVVSAAGRISYASPSTDRVLGLPPSTLLGTSVLDLIHPDDRGAIIASLAGIVDHAGGTAHIAGRMRRGDGAWRDMEGQATNLADDPSVGGFVLNGRDVTDALRATSDLAQARDEAVAAAGAKSEFLAVMSHEIRTPMNAVIGLTDLLLETTLSAEQLEFAGGVKVSAENLLVIINDILDFSKIEAGKVEIEAVDLQVARIADQVGRILADTAAGKGLELLVDTAPDVPSALLGDPVRVQQVLLNLVANAVKFTGRGEVVLRVRLVDDDGTRALIRFEVIDTGIGIAPEDQARLFTAFSQADASTTRRYGGTGLGLAIARQLVELMGGGALGLTSAPDKGSTFWFELPLSHASPSEATVDADAELPSLAGRTALIVDDNATNRLILRKNLHAWGLELIETADGFDALTAAARATALGKPVDFAVLDLNMPGMDGLELAERLRTDPAIAPMELFLLSSSGERLSAAECAARGIADSLTKPVRLSELLDSVMTSVGLRRAPSAEPGATAPSARDGIGRRVLLVEDNKMNQLLASRLLERLGYELDVADNGLLAVEAVGARTYDAVLMDCQMPEMDGYRATAEIRRLQGPDTHTPIIAMTASAMEGDRDACLAAGMDDYITKPVRLDVVAAVLRRWIGQQEGGPGETGAPLQATSAVQHAGPEPAAPQELSGAPQRAPLPAGAGGDDSGSGRSIDPDRLAMLRSLDDGAGVLLGELAVQFFTQAEATRVALGTAVASGDGAAVTRHAHLIHGAAANIGAIALAEICGQLERSGRDGATEEAADLLASFDGEYGHVRAALDAEISEPAR